MQYHDLPNKRTMWLILVANILGFGMLFLGRDTLFDEIGIDCKKKLTQIGLCLLYLAGLLGGLSFFWVSKFRTNITIAETEISRIQGHIDILTEQELENNVDRSQSLTHCQNQMKDAQDKKAEAEDFPKFLEHFGRASYGFFSLGTLLCIIGAG
ncbi:hypothetical protein [Algiphilus sp.]|uniref:hypothetical protein n=1 Tax=Algiphilus sp. TaxID=1872431 RepID=UPI003BA8C834